MPLVIRWWLKPSIGSKVKGSDVFSVPDDLVKWDGFFTVIAEESDLIDYAETMLNWLNDPTSSKTANQGTNFEDAIMCDAGVENYGVISVKVLPPTTRRTIHVIGGIRK